MKMENGQYRNLLSAKPVKRNDIDFDIVAQKPFPVPRSSSVPDREKHPFTTQDEPKLKLGWKVVSTPGVDSPKAQADAMMRAMETCALVQRFYNEFKPEDVRLIGLQLRGNVDGIAESKNLPNKLAIFDEQTRRLEREVALRLLQPRTRKRILRAAQMSLLLFSLALLAIFFSSVESSWFTNSKIYTELDKAKVKIPTPSIALGLPLGLVASGVLLGRFIIFMSMLRNNVSGEADYYIVMREMPTGLGAARDIVIACVAVMLLSAGIVNFGFLKIPDITELNFNNIFGSAKNIQVFLFSFFVGLVVPLIVDRMVKSSKQIVEGIKEPS